MATRFRWLRPAIAVTLGITAAIVIHSCSSKSNPTNPGGGGGGGGAELNSGNIPNNTNFSHTFNTAGSFSYHCTIHSGMTGTVVVGASGVVLDTLTMSTGVAYPTVNLQTGGSVLWMNHSGTTHTVTSD